MANVWEAQLDAITASQLKSSSSIVTTSGT